MYEQDKIEKVAKEFGEIIVTKKIKERITYCGLMDCLKREKMEEDEEVLKSTFKVLDTENKGYISPETVYFCFKALGESTIELNDISNVFRWIKNDAEGEGFLNYQDFVSVLKKFDEKTNNPS